MDHKYGMLWSKTKVISLLRRLICEDREWFEVMAVNALANQVAAACLNMRRLTHKTLNWDFMVMKECVRFTEPSFNIL